MNIRLYTLKTIVLNLNPLELILALSKCSVGDSTISAILNLYYIYSATVLALSKVL